MIDIFAPEHRYTLKAKIPNIEMEYMYDKEGVKTFLAKSMFSQIINRLIKSFEIRSYKDFAEDETVFTMDFIILDRNKYKNSDSPAYIYEKKDYFNETTPYDTAIANGVDPTKPKPYTDSPKDKEIIDLIRSIEF